MTTNFRNSAGTDFDSLFDPYVQGTVPANTGFRTSGGVDLAGRFAPIAFGSKRADVGFRTSAGVDVTNLWAAIGTATYALGFNGYGYHAAATAASGSTGNTSCSRALTIGSDGTWSVGGSGVLTNSEGAPTTGTWLPSGASVSDFEVQFVMNTTWSSHPAGGSTSNSAASYVSCSLSRTCSITATVLSNSANECIGGTTVTVNLKRVSTGVVTVSTLFMDVDAVGWQ